MVCTAARGHTGQGAGLSGLKAREKITNFINRQLFDFQILAAVSEPKSGKGSDRLFFVVVGFVCLLVSSLDKKY